MIIPEIYIPVNQEKFEYLFSAKLASINESLEHERYDISKEEISQVIIEYSIKKINKWDDDSKLEIGEIRICDGGAERIQIEASVLAMDGHFEGEKFFNEFYYWIYNLWGELPQNVNFIDKDKFDIVQTFWKQVKKKYKGVNIPDNWVNQSDIYSQELEHQKSSHSNTNLSSNETLGWSDLAEMNRTLKNQRLPDVNYLTSGSPLGLYIQEQEKKHKQKQIIEETIEPTVKQNSQESTQLPWEKIKPIRYDRIIVENLYKGKTDKEIASIIDRSPSFVSNRLSELRKEYEGIVELTRNKISYQKNE